MDYSIATIAEAISGEVIQDSKKLVSNVTIDSRECALGSLFVAFTGEKVEGHNFVINAAENGASGAIVKSIPDEFINENALDFGIIQVDDQEEALLRFAAWHRAKCDVKMVCVTGSAGKTTTKDMIASVVKEKYVTIKTEGNRNNELGVPLTLLSIDADTEVAVVEMGMRGFGQIERLVQAAKPDICVITNIGEAHMELLGSKSNIAKAKWEIVDGLNTSGIAILNGDDDELKKLMPSTDVDYVTYGFDDTNSVFATDMESVSSGTYFRVNINDEKLGHGVIEKMFVPIPGRHNVQNALAAVCVGLAQKMDGQSIARGLASVESSAMRMKFYDVNGYTVIDDSYNANPEAMKSAIEAAAHYAASKRRVVAILGGMVELGDYSEKGHELVGEYVSSHADVLITTGELAKVIGKTAQAHGMGDNVHICENNEKALSCAKSLIAENDVVLVKGSRAFGTDWIVKGLI